MDRHDRRDTSVGATSAGVRGRGQPALLRIAAVVLVPIGALMILSSGIRMISAGHVGVALLFGKVQPVALHVAAEILHQRPKIKAM